MTKDEALDLALEALELAQDNLRDHGDNCFLHDEGEYNQCFCGKDSLSNHLQSVVEKLDEALNAPLAEQPAQRKPLTEEQINLLINGRGDEGDDDYVEPTGDDFGLIDADLVKLVRRVEAHYGITGEKK